MWPEIELPFIKMKEKYKLPLILFLGLFTSIWTSCSFIISVAQFGLMSGANIIVVATGILSFATISVAVSFGLNWAFKQHDPFYILPWLITKLIEMLLIFIGILSLAVYGVYAWLILPSIITMVITAYISHCIEKTYKKVDQLWETTNTLESSHVQAERLPTIETPHLLCNDKLKTPFVIIIGLLVSFWANCVFSAGLSSLVYMWYWKKLIAGFGVASYIMISLATTYSLFYGLRMNDPDFVRLWLINKIVDETAIILGICFVIADKAYNWGLIHIGILAMGIGFYVMRCVWIMFKKIQVVNRELTNNIDYSDEAKIEEPSNIADKAGELEIEDPPTYEQFINQAQTNHK